MQHSMAASTSGRCCTYNTTTRPWHSGTAMPLQHQPLRLAPNRRGMRCFNASNTSSSSFTQRAQEFAETAQQRVQEFVQEQQLDRKAAELSAAASKTAKEAYEETEQNVRRTYIKIESEHNISDRVGRIKKSLSETVRDIDQEYSVRRRLKSAYADAQRMLPVWKRQFNEFSSTQFGKASLTLLFVALLFSGLLWQLLNVFWLLWWVSVPVSLFLASQHRRAAEQQAGGAAGSAASKPFGGSSRWGASSSNSSSSSGGYNSNDGPVVDAEWTSLDDDGSSKTRRR